MFSTVLALCFLLKIISRSNYFAPKLNNIWTKNLFVLFYTAFVVQNEQQRICSSQAATLLLPVSPLKSTGNPVKCLSQRHNKQTCRLSPHWLF